MKCPKSKYFNYEIATNYKICEKGYNCDFCKTSKNYSLENYFKAWRYNTYISWEIICAYIIKKYYSKYTNYKNLFSKYITNNILIFSI